MSSRNQKFDSIADAVMHLKTKSGIKRHITMASPDVVAGTAVLRFAEKASRLELEAISSMRTTRYATFPTPNTLTWIMAKHGITQKHVESRYGIPDATLSNITLGVLTESALEKHMPKITTFLKDIGYTVENVFPHTAEKKAKLTFAAASPAKEPQTKAPTEAKPGKSRTSRPVGDGRASTSNKKHPLAVVRTALGMTQGQVADIIGRVPSFISDVENGRSNLRGKDAIKIAAEMKIQPSSLIGCVSERDLGMIKPAKAARKARSKITDPVKIIAMVRKTLSKCRLDRVPSRERISITRVISQLERVSA